MRTPRRTNRRPTHLHLERLELRDNPASVVTAALSGSGVLSLTGTTDVDNITIRLTAGVALITGNGTTQIKVGAVTGTTGTLGSATSPVKSITADMKEGADVVAIDPTANFALPGAATFDLGSGDNALNLVTTGILTIGGNLAVKAADGFDTVVIQGAAGSAVSGAVSLTLGNGGSNSTIDTVAVHGAAGVTLTAGDMPDDLSLNGVTVDKGGLTATGGGGITTVNLGRNGAADPTKIAKAVKASATEDAFVNTDGATVGSLDLNAGKYGDASLNVNGTTAVGGNIMGKGVETSIDVNADLTVGGKISLTGVEEAVLSANSGTTTVTGAVSLTADDARLTGRTASFSAASLTVNGGASGAISTFDTAITIAKNVSVSAKKDADLNVDTSGPGILSVGGNVTLTAKNETELLINTTSVGSAHIKGNLTVTGGSSEDTINATSSLKVDKDLTLNLGGQNNSTSLGTAGQLLAVGGNLTLTGGAGDDTAVFVGVTVAGKTHVLLGAGKDSLTIQDGAVFTGTTTIDLGTGDDTLQVAFDGAAAAGVTFTGQATLKTGDGNDTAQIGSKANGAANTTVKFVAPKNMLDLGTGLNAFDKVDAQVAAGAGKLQVFDNGALLIELP